MSNLLMWLTVQVATSYKFSLLALMQTLLFNQKCMDYPINLVGLQTCFTFRNT